jgi:hypothetical protein
MPGKPGQNAKQLFAWNYLASNTSNKESPQCCPVTSSIGASATSRLEDANLMRGCDFPHAPPIGKRCGGCVGGNPILSVREGGAMRPPGTRNSSTMGRFIYCPPFGIQHRHTHHLHTHTPVGKTQWMAACYKTRERDTGCPPHK